MKITVLNPVLDLSGGARVQSTHWSYLADRGHDVSIVSGPHAPIDWIRVAKDLIKGRGLPDFGVRKATHWNPRLKVKVIEKRRPIVASDLPDADIVIGTWWETVEWLNALPAQKGLKVVFVQGHEVFAARGDQAAHQRIANTYRMPARRIAVSHWLERILKEEYGQTDVTVVPNAIDLDHFNAPERGRNREPRVGFVYATAAFKGSQTVINAIDLAKKKLPNLKVLAFSSEKPMGGPTLPPYVEFYLRPAQAQIPKLYAQCDAWLWGSTNDGFGLPVLEAMACRTPVIATPIGAAPELVTHGGGALVNVSDEARMAEALVSFVTCSDAEWREKSAAARLKASEYRWDSSLALMEKTLLSYVEKREARLLAGAGPHK